MEKQFYSLLSTVKDKSSQALATIQSDFHDFSTIVQEDAQEIAKTVQKTVEEQRRSYQKESIQKDTEHEDTVSPLVPSFSSFSFIKMSTQLLEVADAYIAKSLGEDRIEDKDEMMDKNAQELWKLYKLQLTALQLDKDTYIQVPTEEDFTAWKAKHAKEDLLKLGNEVLPLYPDVRIKFEELVPSAVTEELFWSNYLYKISQLRIPEQDTTNNCSESEEDSSWDVPPSNSASDTESWIDLHQTKTPPTSSIGLNELVKLQSRSEECDDIQWSDDDEEELKRKP